MNVRDFMRELSLTGVPRNEARLLLAHVLHRDHWWLVAHDDYELTPDESGHINALAARRRAGEPVAYLLGEREFYGRVFRCTPAALIPRPETELLIDLALQRLPADFAGSILDVGTGTGCIAITLALERPQAQVTALDVSADALALARGNAESLGASHVRFIESNWFSAVDGNDLFDLIVSNPPYIAPGDAHLSQGDLRFEPSVALVDAVDGLESYRRLASGARRHLPADGWLIVEHGFDQGGTVPAVFAENGFVDVQTVADLAGHPRITLARKR
jgi:release factor glutamine methyltransferase